MGEVSFPSPWRIWTQSQREQMFRGYVTETCKQRGYSDDREWRTDVTGGPHNLSTHLEAFFKKNRGRLDTYRSTMTVAKLAAHHLCPDGSGSGSPSGGVGSRTARHLMGVLELFPALLFPWLTRPQAEMASFSGLVFAGESASTDAASPPTEDYPGISPSGLDASSALFEGGGWMCGAASFSFLPVAAAPAMP